MMGLVVHGVPQLVEPGRLCRHGIVDDPLSAAQTEKTPSVLSQSTIQRTLMTQTFQIHDSHERRSQNP